MKYTIEVTDEQLSILSNACEMIARMGIGQFRYALEFMPTPEMFPAGWHEAMDEIGKILAPLMKDGHFYYSIHSKEIRDLHKIAWDLYQVFRHRLSWDRAVATGVIKDLNQPRDWKNMFGVDYDQPMKSSDHPLAKIRSEGE